MQKYTILMFSRINSFLPLLLLFCCRVIVNIVDPFCVLCFDGIHQFRSATAGQKGKICTESRCHADELFNTHIFGNVTDCDITSLTLMFWAIFPANCSTRNSERRVYFYEIANALHRIFHATQRRVSSVSDRANEEKRLKIECEIPSALLKNGIIDAAVQTVHNNESEWADAIPSVYA